MITDIRYDEDGFLHGKLLGCMDIYGTDLPDLKVAATEALQCYVKILNKNGQTLEEGLIEIIDDLYSKK
jgi:hypothetical protein